jgi:hypothetical protein
MAFDQAMSTRSLDVTADLSANQFYPVKLNASGQAILCTAITDIVYGVIQNKPKNTTEGATVALSGVTKCVAGAAIAAGARVAPLANGKAKTAGVGDRAFGIARTAAGADLDIFSVELLVGGEQL